MQYAWLEQEPGPKMILEGLKQFGVHEVVGHGSNPTIMGWVDELGIPRSVYPDDDVAWCGLFVAIVAKRAGKVVPHNPLWARNWANFGHETDLAGLGDILVFQRGNGGHVGLYVGEDETAFHVLGGNQSNQVSITRVAKSRLLASRRPDYHNQPANVRPVFLTASGKLSDNEA